LSLRRTRHKRSSLALPPRLCLATSVFLASISLATRGERCHQLYHQSWTAREGALKKQLDSQSTFVQTLFRICLILVWLSTRVAASDPSLDISQLAHTAWSSRDGSFRGNINTIGQTSDGYLWLGTGFGLLRFDGVRFVEWQPRKGDSLPRLPIQKVLGTRDGSLWIGGIGGFARLKDGNIKHYSELDGVTIFAILEDRSGTIWVGGLRRPNARLCSIKDDQVHCDGNDGKFGESVRSLYEDKAGNLWVGSSTGLWHWSPGSPKTLPQPGYNSRNGNSHRCERKTVDGGAARN
jgi:hypothetical protein